MFAETLQLASTKECFHRTVCSITVVTFWQDVSPISDGDVKVLHLLTPVAAVTKHFFTLLLCKQAIWAVYNGSHNFFAMRLAQRILQ